MSAIKTGSRIYLEAPEFELGHRGRCLLACARLRASVTLLAFLLGVMLPPLLFSGSVVNLATGVQDLLGGMPVPALTELSLALQPVWLAITELSQSKLNWAIAAAVIGAVFYLPGTPMRPVLFRLAFLTSTPFLKLNLAVAASAIADALRRGEDLPAALNQAYEGTPYPALAERLQEWRQDLLKEQPLRRGGHRVDEVMSPLRSLLAEMAADEAGMIAALDDLAELSWSRKDLATPPVAPNLILIFALMTTGSLLFGAILPLLNLLKALGG